jgi:hypothetical protein
MPVSSAPSPRSRSRARSRGVATAAGTLPFQDLHFPYSPALRTAHLYVQAVAIDPGQAGLPVVVSQGNDLVWPPASGTLAPTAYTYSNDITGATLGSGPFAAGSVICGFER